MPQLKQLAGLVTSGLPNRKADVIELIATYLSNPDNLHWEWQQLDEIQQAAVAEMVHSDETRLDTAQFKAKYGQKPELGKFGYGYSSKNSLSHLDLFFYYYHIPLDLKEQLKTFVPPPRKVELNTNDLPETITQTFSEFDYEARSYITHTVETPILRVETERAALQDVYTVLRLIEAGKIRASNKTFCVTAAGAKTITEALYGGDFYPPDEVLDDYDQTPIGPIKAFAWPLILQSAGLAKLSGTKLELTSAGQKALRNPPEQAIQTAWQKWLKSKLLDEFNRIDAIKGQTGKGKRQLTAVSGRRTTIAAALAECQVNHWLAFDEFSRYMRAAGHTFEVARDFWNFYIADPHYGSLGYSGYNDWHIVQARYLLAFLFEYAATLGLIDVAYIHPIGARRDYGDLWGTDDLSCLSRYDGLLYFRLNNLGAWVLGLTGTYTPSPVEQRQILKVLPNFDVVATGPLPPGDHLFLEQFAAQTAENVWKIDRARLIEALENRQPLTDVETFLQANSGADLPNPVAVLLTETAERVASLHNRGEALLIEANDPVLAQLIANDGKLRSLCLLAGEQTIVIPKENEAAFRRTLRQLGYGVTA
ncbi:MAG: hypothetical protein KDF65_15855 [Anaerolineae bacterium]|nr:hypothetical protein [Anaerolineae bacterium]